MAQKMALCIGINNYPGTDADLSRCLNDVKGCSRMFAQQGFTVQKLADVEATKKNIPAAIKQLVSMQKKAILF